MSGARNRIRIEARLNNNRLCRLINLLKHPSHPHTYYRMPKQHTHFAPHLPEKKRSMKRSQVGR